MTLLVLNYDARLIKNTRNILELLIQTIFLKKHCPEDMGRLNVLKILFMSCILLSVNPLLTQLE